MLRTDLTYVRKACCYPWSRGGCLGTSSNNPEMTWFAPGVLQDTARSSENCLNSGHALEVKKMMDYVGSEREKFGA